ncbi:hypothetical protein G7Y89_g1727 [Cudoniella acicularis]|uniref:Carboxylesterase type B domain-containing protein n=1 Tax=Cudoniella acicularis TaxID=354080 RepID=A0A8H4RWH8_9HELO|nr:hypothetical protein G7Y89_g1727 [Cudoniella acicularis]
MGIKLMRHGGGIVQRGDTFYWVGQSASKNETPYMYSSTDLLNWKNLGAQASLQQMWRPKIVLPKGGGFWIYGQVDRNIQALESSQMVGGYQTHGAAVTIPPNGYTYSDTGMFEDSDGTWYILTSADHNTVQVNKINTDGSIGAKASQLTGGAYEAPGILKVESTYFLIVSGKTGWRSNPNKVFTSSSINGPWTGGADIAPAAEKTYNSQNTFELTIEGTREKTAKTFTLQNHAMWKVDATTGVVSFPTTARRYEAEDAVISGPRAIMPCDKCISKRSVNKITSESEITFYNITGTGKPQWFSFHYTVNNPSEGEAHIYINNQITPTRLSELNHRAGYHKSVPVELVFEEGDGNFVRFGAVGGEGSWSLGLYVRLHAADAIPKSDGVSSHYFSNASRPMVTVKNGTYAGIHSSAYNQDFFLGIPFAQPPLSGLRFSAPASLNTSFSGVRNATSYPPNCVGYGSDDIPYAFSEDWLHLNVIRPSLPTNTTKLPIVLWAYGGNNEEGGSGDKLFHLTFVVENSVWMGKPIMAVSVNYRVSAWGFLGGKEALDGGATNAGLRDIRLALHWVQENIEAFEGDRTKVTIMGKSAGAEDLLLLPLEEVIVEAPEQVDLTDAMGRTPLLWVAARGDHKSIQILLNHNADPNIMDMYLNPPVSYAADKGHTLCVKLLLGAGAMAEPILPPGVKLGSPLNWAARNTKDLLLLKYLLTYGAQVDGTGVDGNTALIHASRTDNVRLAILLLDYNTDINAASIIQHTPLMTAIMYNSHGVLQLLLDRWEEFSACPRLKGPNLLEIVALYADVETVKLLAEADHFKLKYDANYKSREGLIEKGLHDHPPVLATMYESEKLVVDARRSKEGFLCVHSNDSDEGADYEDAVEDLKVLDLEDGDIQELATSYPAAFS